MITQLLLCLAAGAAGILVFKFASLLCWDLLKYCPTPWGPIWDYNDQNAGKWHFKLWTFLTGCFLTWFVASVCAYEWHRPDLVVWVLFGGFATPVVGIFLLRLLLTIGYGIFMLYERSEIIYEASKTRIVKHLRKHGRIE